MANDNRTHQVEDISNKSFQRGDKDRTTTTNALSELSGQNGTVQAVPAPVTTKTQVGSPVSRH